MRAVVPGEALSGIERGDLPVETEMEIRVPGYGWRAVGMRVSPGDEDGVAGETNPARLTVPGYGSAPLRMTFLEEALTRPNIRAEGKAAAERETATTLEFTMLYERVPGSIGGRTNV